MTDQLLHLTMRDRAAGTRGPLQITKFQWNIPIAAAVFSSAGGYFMMNLVMVQSSLVMKDICSFESTARAIQVHVLAMFVPSFVTGKIINHIGLYRTLVLGYVFLMAASGLGMASISYGFIYSALIFLGIGWNFVYVGGGALLTQIVGD